MSDDTARTAPAVEPDRTRERRLRRLAARHALVLRKSRKQPIYAGERQGYRLVDLSTTGVANSERRRRLATGCAASYTANDWTSSASRYARPAS